MSSIFNDPGFWHRLQFGFTIVYHYLFPQLTMGLALYIVVLKALALRTSQPVWSDLARAVTRIFGINFVMGVVTGLPMEFQFGTNWARFAKLAGPVDLLFNHGAIAECAHVIIAAVVTSSFVVCSIGAFWMLRKTSTDHAAALLKVGTWIGVAASLAVAFPTGDQQAKLVAKHQ